MTRFNSIRTAVCAALAALGTVVTPLVSAEGYTVQQVGGTGYVGYDLSNSGQVVGTVPGSDFSLPGGFLWKNGTTTLLMAPPGTATGFPPGSVAYVSGATGINSSGKVVGTSSFLGSGGGSTNRASVWSGGSPTLLAPPSGYTASQGYGINSSGQIVGYSSNSCCTTVATLWSKGTTTNLGTLGGSSSFAFGINSSGNVVGMSLITGDTAVHATLWSGGNIIDLGAQRALSINNTGQIVGQGSNASGSGGATFWNSSASAPMDLGWGSGPGAIANDLNNTGSVVGTGEIGGSWAFGSAHGLLWDGTTSFDLNSLLDVNTWGGWTITGAIAINDNGQILVSAESFLGSSATLLLTPCKSCSLVTADLYWDWYSAGGGLFAFSDSAVAGLAAIPEPETYAMLLVGLGLLGLQARRRMGKAFRAV